MRTIILFISLLVITSCDYPNANVSVETTDIVIDGRTLNTYTIDSCEYIGRVTNISSQADFLTHKGNCKFCKLRNEQ